MIRLIRWLKLQRIRDARRKRDHATLIRRVAESPYPTLALADGRTVKLTRPAFMLWDGVLHELGGTK